MHFLDACFGSFRVCFFCCINQRVIPICACSFSFFWGALLFFFALLLLILAHIAPGTRCSAIIPPVHHSLSTTTFAVDFLFFSLCAYVTKYPLLTHLELFLSCFCFTTCICIYIYLHPSESFFSHLHSSAPFFAKLPKT